MYSAGRRILARANNAEATLMAIVVKIDETTTAKSIMRTLELRSAFTCYIVNAGNDLIVGTYSKCPPIRIPVNEGPS